MSMPGFSAESALYSSAARYRPISIGVTGGEGAVIPAQFECTDFEQCSGCFHGRQFCRFFRCRPTPTGSCRCRLLFRGILPCDPEDQF
jgi:hypothetical protein